MRSEFAASAYTSQAGLLLAGTLVVSAPERASDELKYVMEHTKDPELAMVARTRLARVLAGPIDAYVHAPLLPCQYDQYA